MNNDNPGLQPSHEGLEPSLHVNDPILKALNDSARDRVTLEKEIKVLFTTLWTDFLNIAFEWFPHNKNDRSPNERAYNGIRHRVLRVGNDQVRRLPIILGDYVTVQVRKTQVTKYVVRGTGPFNLPAGVKIRERDQK